MNKKNKLLLFLIFLLLALPLASAGDIVGITLSQEDCQVSCTDDATGEIYTVALEATAWIDKEGGLDSCGLRVDEFMYDGDTLLNTDDTALRYLDSQGETDEEMREYGLYGDETDEIFYNGFYSGILEQLGRYDIIWKLLYASSISLEQDDEQTYITATYNHQIDPCAADGTYVELEADCDSRGDDEIGILCHEYIQEQRQEESLDYDIECQGSDCEEIEKPEDPGLE